MACTDAYRYVRRLPDRSERSSDLLREHVRRTCHELNATLFADPLPVREANDIAKSIHKWITTKSDMWRGGALACDATFIAIQSARGRKGGCGNKSFDGRRVNEFKEKFEKYVQEVLEK